MRALVFFIKAVAVIAGLAGAPALADTPQKRPNIVWIVAEDISPFIGAFGYKGVRTPHIDALAKDGVRYDKAFATSGVCAPSRSSLITGMYQTSIGTHHMRTQAIDPKFMGAGVPNYSAVLPAHVKAFPEFLRRHGYYTTNNEKQDYQFDAPVTVWDENGPTASHRNRPAGKPFFSVYNLYITHESTLFQQPRELQVDPASVEVPPYYPDTPNVRADMARMLTNVQIMDEQVGSIVKRLKEDGLYDQTVIFFYSDHGGVLPWMKREVLERGLHVPLVIRMPPASAGGGANGTVYKGLVSLVDFAPTVLSLAGVKIPEYMQGQAFLGPQKAAPRTHVFGARDRMDELYDRVRSVRNERFQYVYNYMPGQPAYQHLTFRLQIPMMRDMLALRDAGKLPPEAMAWFKPAKAVEELYDLEQDPHQLVNLAGDPRYAEQLAELRQALAQWTQRFGDLAAIPEKQMVADWWQDKDVPPRTAHPVVRRTAQGFVIDCATPGASIGYRITRQGAPDKPITRAIDTFDMKFVFRRVQNGQAVAVAPSWSVYDGQPIQLNKGDVLHVHAMRIGFTPSTLTHEVL